MSSAGVNGKDQGAGKKEHDPDAYHVPVMLAETLDGLQIQPDGVYVDCTFGGGGHSRGILERLSGKGKLFAFDQDRDARQNLPDDPRVQFIPHNFRHLQRMLRLAQCDQAQGFLFARPTSASDVPSVIARLSNEQRHSLSAVSASEMYISATKLSGTQRP